MYNPVGASIARPLVELVGNGVLDILRENELRYAHELTSS